MSWLRVKCPHVDRSSFWSVGARRRQGEEERIHSSWNPLHHLFLFNGEVLKPVRLRSMTSGDDTIRKGRS